MLRTPFCDLVGIDVPIIQAPMASWTTPELVAAVSNAGGLGSYATGMRPLDQVVSDIGRIRALTDRPFAINFLMWAFDPGAFEFALTEPPAVVSFAAGAPADAIRQAREAGSLAQVQVNTVEQARQARSLGADVIVAQGTEAGGLTGTVALMPLLPQVSDAVAPIPVIAAGGMADGRALAAAMILGAQGVNVGTRFIASAEAQPGDELVQMVVRARSEDTLRATILNRMFPPPDGTFPVAMRSLTTAFLDEWEGRWSITEEDLAELRSRFGQAAETGRMHEYISGAGQSVGMIDEVLPAAEIVRRLIADAEAAIAATTRFAAPAP